MKTKLLLILFFGLFQVSHSQEHAWVYFTDKPNEATFLAAPLTMLSQEALDRRAQYGILPDSKDVPLETTYVSQIASATGISVLARSKWLNALHIEGTEVNINGQGHMTKMATMAINSKTFKKSSTPEHEGL